MGADRPAWIDQLLSPESLRSTGWFDPEAVARERAAQIRFPRITPKRIIMDLSLTCVIATQLWHHIYLGGGLCELPTWEPPSLDRSMRRGQNLLTRPFPTGMRATRQRLRRPDGLAFAMETGTRRAAASSSRACRGSCRPCATLPHDPSGAHQGQPP